MIDIYGIPNCDTVQKALKWMDKQGVSYRFHNYREESLTEKLLTTWLRHLPKDKLINARSTAFKELPAGEKEGLEQDSKAIALMLTHPSIIKRPVWHFGKNDYFLGWDEKVISAKLL